DQEQAPPGLLFGQPFLHARRPRLAGRAITSDDAVGDEPFGVARQCVADEDPAHAVRCTDTGGRSPVGGRPGGAVGTFRPCLERNRMPSKSVAYLGAAAIVALLVIGCAKGNDQSTTTTTTTTS